MATTYNRKEFLLPTSPDSMACYHAKVQDDMMKLTIHDCRGSVQLWNDLKTKEGVKEAIEKIGTLTIGMDMLRLHLIENYLNK
jgi:hypothetical protein